MKKWLRIGLISVAIYVFIFLFNYVFVRDVRSEFIMSIVTAPVYFLLSMFGITEFGVFFIAGIVFYFAVGIAISILEDLFDHFYSKFFDYK